MWKKKIYFSMVGQALNPLLNLAKNNQGFDQLKAMKSVDQTKDR